MIRITRIRKPMGTTKWCRACIGQTGTYDLTVCEVCCGFVATFYNCPECFMVSHYYGFAQDEECKHCKVPLPDVIDLQDKVEQRIGFSLS